MKVQKGKQVRLWPNKFQSLKAQRKHRLAGEENCRGQTWSVLVKMRDDWHYHEISKHGLVHRFIAHNDPGLVVIFHGIL